MAIEVKPCAKCGQTPEIVVMPDNWPGSFLGTIEHECYRRIWGNHCKRRTDAWRSIVRMWNAEQRYELARIARRKAETNE
jgi:hypothetical protein